MVQVRTSLYLACFSQAAVLVRVYIGISIDACNIGHSFHNFDFIPCMPCKQTHPNPSYMYVCHSCGGTHRRCAGSGMRCHLWTHIPAVRYLSRCNKNGRGAVH
jgi:hypothetical protein